MSTPVSVSRTVAKFHRGVRFYHWIGFLLVVIAYTSINLRVLFAKGTPERVFVAETHFLVGIAVLILAVPRIFNRLRAGTPPIQPPLSSANRLFSGTVQITLYAFLIIQPILGILARTLSGRDIGLPLVEVAIPTPFAAHEELAHAFESVHIWIGEAFYYVIGLHIVATLWHLLARRDDTLQRML